jgi:excisionase family DNA binding protein
MELPEPTYTVLEAEKLLGLPYKAGYRLIKEHQIRGVKDVTGRIRIPYGEVYAVLKARERGESHV